jgi:thioredoxin 1
LLGKPAMEDAKLEAYYNELKASAPKGKTGGLGSLRGPGNGGGFASAAQRADAKHGRNAAKPAGTNNLYKMFVKAGEGGFVSYDDNGNIIEEKQKPEEDDGPVGLIPCLAKLRNDPEMLNKLARDKENLNLKRKRASNDEVTTKRKKKELKKDKTNEIEVAKPKKDKKQQKEKKKSKKDKKRQEEEAEIEAVLAAAAKIEAEKSAAANAVKLLSTKAEFDSCLKSSKKTGAAVLVDFSATWCGPCQSIAPVFAKLATAHPNAVYAKVDADENQESCDAAGVTSFPMFHVYSMGNKVAEVDGADKKALKKLAKQYAEPVKVKTDEKKKKKEKKKEKEKAKQEGGTKTVAEAKVVEAEEPKKKKKKETKETKEKGEQKSEKKKKNKEADEKDSPKKKRKSSEKNKATKKEKKHR